MSFSVSARKFFRTPKGLLIIVLVVVAAMASTSEGVRLVIPGLASAVAAAVIVDAPILRWRGRRWVLPSGAILTGLLIAMVLSPREPWYVGASASALAIVSKYLVRTRVTNVFNPAALALVATFYVFESAQSWWGALPEFRLLAGLPVLLASGIFITDRVNKSPIVLAFLGGYFALFTGTAFLGDPSRVAEAFVAPDLQAVLFFAFFILTDPPTTPITYRDQVVCGVVVAAVSYFVFEWVDAPFYLLAGVLVGNVLAAWNRRSRRKRFRPGVRRRPAQRSIIVSPVAMHEAPLRANPSH